MSPWISLVGRILRAKRDPTGDPCPNKVFRLAAYLQGTSFEWLDFGGEERLSEEFEGLDNGWEKAIYPPKMLPQEIRV